MNFGLKIIKLLQSNNFKIALALVKSSTVTWRELIKTHKDEFDNLYGIGSENLYVSNDEKWLYYYVCHRTIPNEWIKDLSFTEFLQLCDDFSVDNDRLIYNISCKVIDIIETISIDELTTWINTLPYELLVKFIETATNTSTYYYSWHQLTLFSRCIFDTWYNNPKFAINSRSIRFILMSLLIKQKSSLSDDDIHRLIKLELLSHSNEPIIKYKHYRTMVAKDVYNEIGAKRKHIRQIQKFFERHGHENFNNHSLIYTRYSNHGI